MAWLATCHYPPWGFIGEEDNQRHSVPSTPTGYRSQTADLRCPVNKKLVRSGMMGRGERVRVSVCTAYLYVLQSFAGKEVSFVAFADFGKIIAGRPSGLALFVADNFNFLDL